MTSAASGICVVIKPRRAAGYTHHEGNMGRDVMITGGVCSPRVLVQSRLVVQRMGASRRARRARVPHRCPCPRSLGPHVGPLECAFDRGPHKQGERRGSGHVKG